jgi:hypothetical protein
LNAQDADALNFVALYADAVRFVAGHWQRTI